MLCRVDRKVLRVPRHLDQSETKRGGDIVDFAKPFRFPTSHSANRSEGNLGRARDLRSVQLVRPSARRSAPEKAGGMGVGSTRAIVARNENTLRRWRGNVRRNS